MAENEKQFDLEKATRNFQKAAECCSQGRFDAAKDLLLKGIKACPTHSESHRLLGQIYFQNGDTEKAENTVLEALRLDPKNMWALILMGNIFAKDKDKSDVAETYYNKVLEYYPDNAIALNNVAGTFLAKSEYSKGILYLEKALEIDDTYINSYYGLALAHYKNNNLQDAFKYAAAGVKKGKNRAEDPAVRNELLKLFLTIARDICESTDYESMVFDVARKLENDFNITIKFQQKDDLDTLAKLQFADFYKRDYHLVLYKKDKLYQHYILHELTHLDMMLRAKQAGTLKVIGSSQNNFDLFMQEYKRHFDGLKKTYSQADIQNLAKSLFQGLSLQLMNSPLDMFVEERIFAKTEFRPLQLMSLFNMEQSNLGSVKQTANVQEFPQFIKDTNKLLILGQSLMLKRLYGMDFIANFGSSSNMLNNVHEMFGDFENSLLGYHDGDEYELFERFATKLGLIKYFAITNFAVDKDATLTENIKNDVDHKQEVFDSTHNPESVDPAITMMMSCYMVGAMKYFETLLPEDVKKIAFEIAMVGQNGISPNQKSGYTLKSIPDKDFGGYELLAYYYTSWAQVAPEMLDQLKLPFDKAYELAKQMLNK